MQVPAFLRSNNAKVFGLRFRAFTDTSRYASLDLVRRPQSPVALLYLNSETHAIVQAKTTPGRPHTAFNRSQCLAIGMAAFETGVNQFLPDLRQIAQHGAKQVDALATRDLGIEVIFFSYLSDHD